MPASWPLAQDGPDEPCWTAGTKTLKLPLESVNRNGSSSVTGQTGKTVFCSHWPVKTGDGAPWTPE